MSLSAISAIPLLASLVLSYRASPGTVYIAADSRLTTDSSAEPMRDTACKIRVLNDGIVFVGTGNAIFTSDRITTNIYAVASREATEIPHRPLQAADIRSIAMKWQAAVNQRLSAKLASQASRSAAEPGVGTTGSFYAATANGTVYGITLRIGLDPNGKLQNVEEPQSPTGYLVATGATEAKQQALNIATSPQNQAITWPRKLEAIEAQTILEQSRIHGQNSDIGGPIDLIEITPNGPKWLARKTACR